MIFVISIRNGRLTLSGQQAQLGPRPKEMIALLQDIAHLLPDLDIPISVEDLPGCSLPPHTSSLPFPHPLTFPTYPCLCSRLGFRKELRASHPSSAQFNSSVPISFSLLGSIPLTFTLLSPVLSAEEVEEVHDQPGLHGWPNTCPPDSELRRDQDGLQDISGRRYPFAQSYIDDPVAASNFCLHPDLVQLNGFLSA